MQGDCCRVGFSAAVKLEAARARNRMFQTGLTCGYWAVYFTEEVARRRRGEGTWSKPFVLKERVELVNKIREKLLDALKL